MKRRPAAVLLPLLLPLVLGGCVLEQAIGPALVVGGASVVLTGRTPVDHVASVVTGQDCSIVRLERRESWCAPPPGPPAPQAYCTPSLGRVDCWTSPPPGAGRQMADPPAPVPVPVVPVEAPPAPFSGVLPVDLAPPGPAVPVSPAAEVTPAARPSPVTRPAAARRGDLRT